MNIVVKFTPADRNGVPGKLADAEVHFADGDLDGLKLMGFSIWRERDGKGRSVTFPSRPYDVNGERRSFPLLRPVADVAARTRVRDLVLTAYAEFERETTGTATSQGTKSGSLGHTAFE